MSEFDSRARDWDNDPIHWERSEAIAKGLLKMIPVNSDMKAMEYGAGTGILSFLLAQSFNEITLIDNSKEMVQVMHEKVNNTKAKNLKPLLFDLENCDYFAHKFDLIFSQMVLHHVTDPKQLFNRFYQILNPGGYLAIADLYSEDGSFHGEGVAGHKGFDVTILQTDLEKAGFTHITVQQCYTIKKTKDDILQEYPVFLLAAAK
jgi:tRNA (cmo5U34)-methyltransferase